MGTRTPFNLAHPDRTALAGLVAHGLAAVAGALVFSLLSAMVAPAPPAGAVAGRASTLGLTAADFAAVEHRLDGVAESSIAVSSVRHGDLDGDGLDDAVAVLSFREDDESYWLVQSYRIADGAVVPTAKTHRFLGAWERFDRLAVSDATIEFTVRTGEGPHGYLEVHRWAEVDGRLRLLERVAGGSLRVLDAGVAAAPTIESWSSTTFLDIAPGGSYQGAFLEIDEATSMRVEADDPDARLRLYDAITGVLLDELRVGEIVAFPRAGTWYAQTVTQASRWTRFKLTVADPRALYAPRLVMRMHEDDTGPTGDAGARRSVSLAWYELTWAHGPVDIDSVNQVIRDFVDGIEQRHRAEAARCPEGTDATLYVGATPELVSYDLVSFRFTVQSCLCESNDEVVELGLTIDLTTGRVLDLNELTNDRDLLVSAWLEQRRNDEHHYGGSGHTSDDASDQTGDHASDSGGGEQFVPTFTSATLTPHGLVLQEASTETFIRTHLLFASHPGVVTPAIVQRASSGADVQLPYQGCGC